MRARDADITGAKDGYAASPEDSLMPLVRALAALDAAGHRVSLGNPRGDGKVRLRVTINGYGTDDPDEVVALAGRLVP